MRKFAIFVGVVVIVLLALDWFIRHQTNRVQIESGNRVLGPMNKLARIAEAQMNQSVSPKSVAELVATSNPISTVEWSKTDRDIADQAVLFTNVTLPDGRKFAWYLGVKVPKGYPIVDDRYYFIGPGMPPHSSNREATVLRKSQSVVDELDAAAAASSAQRH